MEIEKRFNRFFFKKEEGISIAIYRFFFGLLMCFSLIRFRHNGWIEACYKEPEFHFTYQYFHWIRPFLYPEWIMTAIVLATALLAIFVAIGFLYRFSIVLFFIFFTYLELIEKSWYLNHYYFISIIAFLLIFIPAHHRLSLDNYLGIRRQRPLLISYSNVLRLQISIVYFFAGIAKINPDWLFKAMPLKIWLKTKIDIPIIGDFLAYDATAYLFSYSGMFYDLIIPFLLWNKKTRPFALITVLCFHSMTAILFQIGMFPWIMIMGSLIFITDQEWKNLLSFLHFRIRRSSSSTAIPPLSKKRGFIVYLFVFHLLIQLALPLRHIVYRENHRWTERNFRFAWNVMLVEKSGHAVFRIQEHSSDRKWTEYPSSHLTPIQVKQMSYQADMIWEYAQFLKSKYLNMGVKEFSIYVDCHVAFNGRPPQQYLPQDLDLTSIREDQIYNYVHSHSFN